MSVEIKHPVMRYHGSKFRLADWVMSFFPEHDCYVEPFGGAAGVLMQKPRSYAEVYNDLDGQVVNVFRVLQDDSLRSQLIEMCVLMPFSREEFLLSHESTDDPVKQACRTLFRSEAGFGSGGSTGHKTGFRADSKRKYSLASHIWSRYPDRIAAFGDRLSGVIIENRPAIDVIKATDNEDTLFFIDPPYLLDKRVLSRGHVYRHEMTDDDHRQLLEVVVDLKGYVVLSGYASEIYNEYLSGWESHKKKSRISSGRGTGLREEVVWLNNRCAAALGQPALDFGSGAQ